MADRCIKKCAIAALFFTNMFVFVNTRGFSRDFKDIRESIKGAFHSYLCRGDNSLQCNGNGECVNGKCICLSGYTGTKCELENGIPKTTARMSPTTNPFPVSPANSDIYNCTEEIGTVCNRRGVCQMGRCVCQRYWTGARCELSMRKGFCDVYKECAECTALMETCPSNCSAIAKFYLVFDFPTGESFQRCRYKNTARNCTYFFQQTHVLASGREEIMVKACLQGNAVPTTSDISQSTNQPVIAPDNPDIYNCTEDVGTVCNRHGVCKNGQCVCQRYWTGVRCELSMWNGFCNAYKECAECTALLETCPSKCSATANFYLVFDFPTGQSFQRCRYKNIARGCTYFFQQKNVATSDRINIMVRACLPVKGVTTTSEMVTNKTSTIQPITSTDEDDNKTGVQDTNKGWPYSGATKQHGDLLLLVSFLYLLRVEV